jgi:hypothetical protein
MQAVPDDHSDAIPNSVSSIKFILYIKIEFLPERPSTERHQVLDIDAHSRNFKFTIIFHVRLMVIWHGNQAG